jgi:predicted dehydrogenase
MSAPADPAPQGRVRVAVIGTGGIARVHLGALRALPAVELAALCDLDAPRLHAAAARWGTPQTRTFADYRRMLDDVRPDGVWVLVSVPATFAVAAECLRRGFDTLLEKPPGLRTDETRELAALAERHHRRAMVAFNRRFNPYVRRAWQAVRDAGGGPPAAILAEYHKGPQQYADYPPEVNARWIGVDAIHALDLLRHLGGPVRAVRARSDAHQHGDSPDSFHGTVEFASGTIGHLVSTYTSVPKIERLQLFGDRCWAVTEGIGSGMNTGRLYRDGAFADLVLPPEDTAGSDALGYWAEDRHFVECLRTGRPLTHPAATAEDAVRTMELVDAFLAGWRDERD